MYEVSGVFFQFGIAAYIIFNNYLSCDTTKPGFYTAIPSYVENVNGSNQINFPGNWITNDAQFSTSIGQSNQITISKLTNLDSYESSKTTLQKDLVSNSFTTLSSSQLSYSASSVNLSTQIRTQNNSLSNFKCKNTKRLYLIILLLLNCSNLF